MDGLECSEIKLSTVIQYHAFRIDSHFYEKQYFALKNKIDAIPCEILKNIVAKPIQTGHTPSMAIEEYYGGNIPLIKTNNLHENTISTVFDDYLTQQGNALISRTELVKDDIITTIIGATEEIIARSALVTEAVLPANINQNIAQIRIDPQKMAPEYVNAYLNSFYGKQYLLYLSRQTEQVNLNCKEVEIVPIPIVGKQFQENIVDLTKKATALSLEALEAYKTAEKYLSNVLTETQSSHAVELPRIKPFQESYKKSGRLDAEYYQEKYERYTEMLHTNETVNSLCKLHDKTYLPKEAENYRYIELSNVGLTGDISGVDAIIGAELPSRARRRVKAGQIVVSSVEGSLKSCALVTKDYDECLCSTGFYILDSEYINPETLLVLFKSEPIQALMKQRCSGTILAGITKDELLSMPLPKIDEELQKDVSKKVQESFALRQQSKQLLEYAKQAVEMAIEKGEAAALAWLKGAITNSEV